MATSINDSVQFLKSIGPKKAESFNAIGIYSIRDLIYYFPSRYLDRTTILNSSQVVQYVSNGYEGEVTITGRVIDTEMINYGKKRLFKVSFQDESGFFDCVWFQGIKYFQKYFVEDQYYAVSAKPVISRYGNLQFTHPDFDRLSTEESEDFLNTGKIIPFYRIPAELKSKNLGDLGLRKVIKYALENYITQIKETLPKNIISQNKLIDLGKAIINLHFPTDSKLLDQAQKRFKYEELFYTECLVALRKEHYKTVHQGISFNTDIRLVKEFINSLPFDLTEAQVKVFNEITTDMNKPQPMNRLIQGDVGSGKTIVALLSMLIAYSNGYQSVLMVPTEILANQHFKNILKMLAGTDIQIDIIVGGQKKSERNTVLKNISSGQSDIIIGTHALFEDNVEFNKLGLVVVDEQHRFGVVQKARLIDKGIAPDVMVMTATPIPRALTLTLYGDLEVSVIDQMPKNRKQIRTALRHDSKLPDIYKFIVDKAKEGCQSFIVYPLVEESEKLELKSAEEYYKILSETYLSKIRIALIHGKMHWRDKDLIMSEFAEGKYDVLLSTTVIEVGIDVPNANIILINDSTRFGLAQLHQLRGRVGRGSEQAYCILLSNIERMKLPQKFNFDFSYMSRKQIEENKSRIRLNAMERFPSGFDLSEIDLKLRGPGDIFGTRQSGFPEFKYSNIIEDRELLIKAKSDAFNIITNDPSLTADDNKLIKNVLHTYYKENLKYAQIA